jgi:hypothetical protein
MRGTLRRNTASGKVVAETMLAGSDDRLSRCESSVCQISRELALHPSKERNTSLAALLAVLFMVYCGLNAQFSEMIRYRQ